MFNSLAPSSFIHSEHLYSTPSRKLLKVDDLTVQVDSVDDLTVLEASVYCFYLLELKELPYWSHYSKVRLFIHTITNSKYFDLAIACVIGLNVITMATEYHMMPKVCFHFSVIFPD